MSRSLRDPRDAFRLDAADPELERFFREIVLRRDFELCRTALVAWYDASSERRVRISQRHGSIFTVLVAALRGDTRGCEPGFVLWARLECAADAPRCESLTRLANIEQPESELGQYLVQKYFDEATRALALDPPHRRTVLLHLAKRICDTLSAGELSPRDAAARIAEIERFFSGHEPHPGDGPQLLQPLRLLSAGVAPHTFETLSHPARIDELIIAEAKVLASLLRDIGR